MDIADIDKDGDKDIVIGANTSVMSDKLMFQRLIKWQKEGGALVFLENTQR